MNIWGIGLGSILSRLEAFSFATWVRMEGDPSTASNHTLMNFNLNSTNRVFAFLKTGSGAGRFECGHYNGGYVTHTSNRGRFNDGQWHHLVFTMSAGTVQVYTNGRLAGDAGTTAQGTTTGTGLIGRQIGGSNNYSEARQYDIQLFDRVISAAEVLAIYRNSSPPSDYVLRYRPTEANETTIVDETDTYNAAWVDYNAAVYEEFEPWTGFARLYAIGNSLTVDALPFTLAKQVDYTINTGEKLSYTYANPASSNYDGSYLWGTALAAETYPAAIMQIFCSSPFETPAEKVTSVQNFIDEINGLQYLVIHDGHPSANQLNGVSSNQYWNALNASQAEYSAACMDYIVAQIEAANPTLTVLRSRVLECVQLVRQDLENAESTGTITAIGETGTFGATTLFRDTLHLNYSLGRYLSHASMRRALGLGKAPRAFPFVGHPNYADVATTDFDYLDSVVSRVWDDDETPVEPATGGDVFDEVFGDDASTDVFESVFRAGP